MGFGVTSSSSDRSDFEENETFCFCFGLRGVIGDGACRDLCCDLRLPWDELLRIDLGLSGKCNDNIETSSQTSDTCIASGSDTM